MAAKVNVKSASKTPQAQNDAFEVSEDSVTYLQVLSNDRGGAGLSLYALSASNSGQLNPALGKVLTISTLLGASATIVETCGHAGRIAYDASKFDYLAKGETVTDTFTYAVRLGNGTISIATVSVTIVGTNDLPTVADVTIGRDAGVVEDGSAFTGSFRGDDIDSDDSGSTLTYQILNQPDEGSVSIDPANPARFVFDPGNDFQDLEEGEVRTVTFQYRAVDRHGAISQPAVVNITVTGKADATSGSAIDGYISGALVFRDTDNDGAWDHEGFTDANGNGRFDAGETFTDSDANGLFTAEAFTFTDAQGNFNGLGGTGRLVVAPVIDASGTVTTVDLSTGDAFTGTLSAPDGATVVTPLTSLVDALAGPGATPAEVASAETLVKAALGIPADIALSTFDPIAAATGSGDPAATAAALEVQKAAVQVANILAVIDATLSAAGVEGGSELAVAALAAQIEDATSPLNLSDATLIEAVITDAAAGSGNASAQATVAAQADAIATSLGNINAVIEQVETGTDPVTALAEIVTAQIVAQDDLAGAAASAIDTGSPLDSSAYEGNALVAQLDDAADEVEVIVPVNGGSGTTFGAPVRPVIDDGTRVNAAEIADGIVVGVGFGPSPGLTAGDSLVLLLGGIAVGTKVLTATEIAAGTFDFSVSAATLGADGAKVLTAKFVAADGASGPASLPLLVTVDTTAPDAPTNVTATEGTIVTIVEAANGTQITGETEAGSSVEVTLTNGTQTLVKQAVVSGTTFAVTLTPTEIEALGEGYVTYSAAAIDAAGNPGARSASGQYVYTRQPIVDPENRLDGPGSFVVNDTEDEGTVGVTPLDGGGFAVHWVTDTNGDGDGDTAAIQRYAADGSKQGDIVLLQGVSPEITDQTGPDEPFDLRALNNGGYALTYALVLEEANRSISFTGNPSGFVTAPVVGRPTEIFVQSAPPGATFSLFGLGTGGSNVSVALTVVDGRIVIAPETLGVFAVDHRLVLRIDGVAAGQTAVVNLEVAQDVRYDTGVALTNLATSGVVANGVAVFATALGRPEAFDINSITYANGTGPTFVVMQVILPQHAGAINIAGIANATVTPAGVLQIVNPPRDVDGTYLVPQQILDQLGTQDAQVLLIIGGAVNGSSFSGTIGMRPSIDIPEGVFVQTFDASGNSTGISPTRLDGPGSFVVNDTEDNDTVGVTPLDGGGFAVHWVTDTNGDGDGDTAAIQRYAADGSKQGGIVLLQGVSPEITDQTGPDEPFDLRALNNGGYALTYALVLEEANRSISFTGNPSGFVTAPVVGRPTEIFVQSAPPGATFSLFGLGTGGSNVSVALTVVDGRIVIAPETLGVFAVDHRLVLRIDGVAAGQTAVVNLEVAQDVRYDTGVALTNLATSGVVANGVAVFATALGRPEAFDINSITYANGTGPTFVVMQVILPQHAGAINIAGIANATVTPAGVLQIVNPPRDVDGTYLVPQQILDQLGTQDAQVLLIIGGAVNGSSFSGTIGMRPSIDIPEGVFVQTFDASGNSTGISPTRLDGPGSFVVNDTEDNDTVGVTPLEGGGFAVHWVTDTNGDGDGDTAAIQRYAADGSKDGSIVLLQGLSRKLVDQASDDVAFDLKALANGGYALSYLLTLEEGFRQVSVIGAPTGPAIVALVGRPTEIFVTSAPTNLSFALSGQATGGGNLKLPVTVVDGRIVVTPDMLGGFAADHRLILEVTGLAAGQTANIVIEAVQDVGYAPTAPLVEVTSPGFTVSAGGVGVLATGSGRPEAFEVNGVSYANGTGPQFTIMQIILPQGGAGINLAGVPGASLVQGGIIQIINPPRGADGVYHVPQPLLDQIGTDDAQVFLIMGGLVPGSSFVGTITVREGSDIPEGVYVETFAPDGTPVEGNLALIGTPGSDALAGDFGDDVVQGLAGTNVLTGGAGSDTFRFDNVSTGTNVIADFNPQSDVIDLTGIDANAATAGDDPFVFIGSAAFSGIAGELRFEVTDNSVLVEADNDGDQIADYVILVTGQQSLVAADFIL